MPSVKRADPRRRTMPQWMETRAAEMVPNKSLEGWEEEILTRHGLVRNSFKQLRVSASVLSPPPVSGSDPYRVRKHEVNVGRSGHASSSRSSFSTLSMLELDEALRSGLGYRPNAMAGSTTENNTTVQEKICSDEADNSVDSQTPGLRRDASYVNVSEPRRSSSGSRSTETHSNEQAPSGVASSRGSNARSSTESFDRLSAEAAGAQSRRSSPGMRSVLWPPRTPNGPKTAASVRYMDWTKPLDFRFDIARSTFGVEALQFVGFTKEKARVIFARLIQDAPSGGKNADLLLHHSCRYVEEMLSKPELLHGDYQHVMGEIGISQEIINRICAPNVVHGCEDLLYTKTLSHWLCDTMTKQWYTLSYLLSRLKVYASVCDSTGTKNTWKLKAVEEEDLENVAVVSADEVEDDDEWEDIEDDEEDEHAGSERPEPSSLLDDKLWCRLDKFLEQGGHIEMVIPEQPQPYYVWTHSEETDANEVETEGNASETKEKPTRITKLDGCDYSDPSNRFADKLDPKDYCLPSTYLMCDSEPPVLEDHVPLWMATTSAELSHQPMFSEDHVRIPMTSGHAGLGSYWTPQREIAEKYRQWAARRAPFSETLLIRILVPKVFVKKLVSPDLSSAESWEDWTRYCLHRTALSKGEPWKDAKDHWASVGLPGLDPDVIMTRIYTGPLAWRPQAMLQSDVRLTEANTIRTFAGTRGTHWVFKKTKDLEEQVRNNVHIEVHAPDYIHHPPWGNI